MYEDEKEEVIHDTLEKKVDSDTESSVTNYLLTKHLRALVREEIAAKFDEQPTSYNSFKAEEMEALVVNKLDEFLEGYTLEEKIKEVCQGMLDDCYVEINTTGYISN